MDRDGIFSAAEMQQFKKWQQETRQRNLAVLREMMDKGDFDHIPAETKKIIVERAVNPFWL